jgi:hypothetical protein
MLQMIHHYELALPKISPFIFHGSILLLYNRAAFYGGIQGQG